MNFLVKADLFTSLKSKGQLKIVNKLIQQMHKDNTVEVDTVMIKEDLDMVPTYFYELMRRMDKDNLIKKVPQKRVYMFNPEKIRRFDSIGGIEDDYKEY